MTQQDIMIKLTDLLGFVIIIAFFAAFIIFLYERQVDKNKAREANRRKPTAK